MLDWQLQRQITLARTTFHNTLHFNLLLLGRRTPEIKN